MIRNSLPIALLFILIPIITSGSKGDEKNPVKLSHRIHMAIENVQCFTCHSGSEESLVSKDLLLPLKENCAVCHDVNSSDKCSVCHLDTDPKEFTGYEIETPKLLFNHKYHTVERNLPCFFCHGDIQTQDVSTKANMPPMATCFNCHNDKTAPTECAWCHVSEDELRPEFHTADWLHKHRTTVNSPPLIAEENCMMCHKENWCQDCHVASQLTESSPQSVFPFYRPSEWGKKPQVASRVHSLNYRFVHPLDAKGKERFCTTCHEFTEFCVVCHREAQNNIMPKWHQGADWAPSIKIFGGRHADFARRDLERCMGCHDLQGRATTCLRCHVDNR